MEKDKSLKKKAIQFKGKSYVLVSDRVVYFNDNYPNGSIVTRLLSAPESDMVIIKAKITPDMEKPTRYFTGMSQARWGDTSFINKSSALENAETSAVGRAMGMMGIGVLESIASLDEINKTTYRTPDRIQEDAAEAEVENFGTHEPCPDCGAPMKYSLNTKKWYCSKICWKNKPGKLPI